MADYETITELRNALNSDDRGRFLDAADVVRDAGFSVDDILGADPPEDALVDAGVVAETSGMEPHDQHALLKEIRDLLQEIRDNTGGS